MTIAWRPLADVAAELGLPSWRARRWLLKLDAGGGHVRKLDDGPSARWWVSVKWLRRMKTRGL